MADVARAEQAVETCKAIQAWETECTTGNCCYRECRRKGENVFLDLCLLCSVLLGSVWGRSSEFQENEQAWQGRVI